MSNRARTRAACVAAAIGCLAARSGHVAEPNVYRWVDGRGIVHYGDQIPPKYSTREREVVNPEGIVVQRLSAQKTPAEIAAEQQKELAAKARRERDRNLLNTYVSVEDIKRLRDRRLTLLEDQVKVTAQFLDILDAKLAKLLAASGRYRPYAADPKAPPMPDQLADDIVRVRNDIHTQRQNLAEKQGEATAMRAQFDSDIARFKKLKGIH
ncbi:MAG: DUF4124 domain-containing protein [Steroidobacteraceae bacterium]|nr:DUF4124 domain-containing protein [Steroidobacteraceae bacterium]